MHSWMGTWLTDWLGTGVQIGYCGLDNESLGAGPDAASLDITDYCEGYVSWDLLMVFIQVMRCWCRAEDAHMAHLLLVPVIICCRLRLCF